MDNHFPTGQGVRAGAIVVQLRSREKIDFLFPMTKQNKQPTKRAAISGQDDMYREYARKLRKRNCHEIESPIPRSVQINGIAERKRKLILHFDLRNTVLISDSVTNVSLEQALNSFLTGVVWVREINGNLEWASDKPSLSPPAPDCNTYYKYLEKLYVKNPSSDRVRTSLRQATGDFTQTKVGEKFRPCFLKHLALLKWTHPFDKAKDDILTNHGLDGSQYHYLLKSFYKLVYHLYKEKRDFAVVLRTYGLDAPNVLKSVKYGISGGHPDYPGKLDLPLQLTPGTINRGDGGMISLTYVNDTEDRQVELTSHRDIYDYFTNCKGISGFKDDFIYWQDHSYHYSTAKPFLIDLQDNKSHHIFFDDNMRSYEDDSIVNLRLFESTDSTTSRCISRKEASKFENILMVQADALSAIEDDDYYINSVHICEKNYENYLRNLSS